MVTGPNIRVYILQLTLNLATKGSRSTLVDVTVQAAQNYRSPLRGADPVLPVHKIGFTGSFEEMRPY